MSEPVWSVEYLYDQALQLAKKSNHELSIDHFWFVADRDLAGAAPRDMESLFARAINYTTFDKAIAKYGIAGDPDIDASLRRLHILSKLPEPKSPEDALRSMCKTNLLFLAREIFNNLVPFSTHPRLCTFFLPKHPPIPSDKPHHQP